DPPAAPLHGGDPQHGWGADAHALGAPRRDDAVPRGARVWRNRQDRSPGPAPRGGGELRRAARPRLRTSSRFLTAGSSMTDSRDAAGLDAVLEALSFERRAKDARAFEDLFLRFQRRFACETLTRHQGDPQAFDAGRFFAEWVEEERGLAGEERARAFEWLAVNCGFNASLADGTCVRPWAAPERHEVRRRAGDGGVSSKVKGVEAHRLVVATVEGRRILADAALPLPVLLPLDPPAREIPTGMGSLSATVAPDGSVRVTCDGRGE